MDNSDHKHSSSNENKTRAAEYYNKRSRVLRLSRKDLAKELGVDVRTIQRREAAEIVITNEALLALRYICLTKEDQNEE